MIEPLDAFVDAVARREHQDPWRLATGRVLAQLCTNLEAVHPRHGEIEADQVIGGEFGLAQRFETVMSEIDGVPLATQPTGDCLGEFDFIIDHENAHDAEPSAGTGFRSRFAARHARQGHHHDDSRSPRAENRCEGSCRGPCGRSRRSPAGRAAPTCRRRPPTSRSTALRRRKRVRRPSWRRRPDGRRPGP